MLNCNASNTFCAARRWSLLASLVLLLCLVLPTTASASSPDPGYAGPDTCAQCHPTEASIWQKSPHAHPSGSYAQTDVSCEVCHGAYVPDHPQSGVMKLPATGDCCQDCHTKTYPEWHETGHAVSGVQCASCHVPHSQVNRLPAEELCATCHRDEAEHKVHHDAGVNCVDCHLLSDVDTTSDVQVSGPGAAPGHNFGLAVRACVECHSETTPGGAIKAVDTECAQMPVVVERAQELAQELEDTKQANRNLQAMSVVGLGFGLGIGGVLGAIFVLVVGFIAQGRSNR